MKKGTKLYFAGDPKPFTVKACNEYFAIATRPYTKTDYKKECARNEEEFGTTVHDKYEKTVLYTILDFKTGLRNKNNLVFNPYDYTRQVDIDQCMEDLMHGECELSSRGPVKINIVKKV